MYCWRRLVSRRRKRSSDTKSKRIPAGVKHWHGATKDSWFEHIAIGIPAEGAGIPVEVLIKYVSLFQKGKDETKETRKQLLIEQYDELSEK